jgi:hypothetical protein
VFDLKEHLEKKYGIDKQRRFDPESLLDVLFERQLESINLKQRFRAVYCTRRAGKSVSRLIKALYLMTRFKGTRAVYGALTQGSAVNIGWDLFMEFCDDFEITTKTNFKDYKITLPDFGNSSLQFFGLDASEKAARRILGQNLRYFVADEAGSITQNLQRICFQFIRPALIDLAPFSYLDLCGTPENIPNTYFSKVCLGEDKSFDWSIYNWSAFDNPHIAKQWGEEIESIPEEFKLTHEYKCHYLGEFSINTEALMLTFSPKNYVDTSIMDFSGWTAVMGVDLGYNDSTAITVGLYNPDENKNLIIPYAEKETGLDLEEAMLWVQDIQKSYNAVKIVIDGANKQGVEYMRKRFPVPMEAADKQDKGTFLRALQADITALRVLVDPRACMPLLEECESAIWDEQKKAKGHLIEDPRCVVDQIDSFLYLHRHSAHYIYKKKPKEIKKDSNEYWDKYWTDKIEEQESADSLEQILMGRGHSRIGGF